MQDTQQLLREYAEIGSETAFRELVARYIDLVYSTARRVVGGDTHLAEDVTQTVFLHLSRKARKLSRRSMLGGWLYRDAWFVASKTLRRERRRQAREREAVLMHSLPDHSEANLEQLTPILDEAINRLASKDRSAILLRFFEQRDFRAIGAELGTNENAARMRVNRALEKLHVILKRRGVTLSAAVLGAALADQAVTAAPAGLAACVAGVALASSGATAAFSASTLKTMAIMTKLKTGLIGAVVLGGLVTSLILRHQAAARQHALDESLRRQAEQLAQLTAGNERLAKLAARANSRVADEAELVRLRSETASLRQKTSSLRDLRLENRRLQTLAAQSRTPLQATEESMAKGAFTKDWLLAFVLYTMEHNGWFPTTFEQAASFLPPEAKAETNVTTAQFEIVYQGTRTGLTNPGATIVLREKQPWIGSGGKWVRIYGFGDGHAEAHTEPEGDFDAFERQHLAPMPPPSRSAGAGGLCPSRLCGAGSD